MTVPLTTTQAIRMALGEDLPKHEWNMNVFHVLGPGCYVCEQEFDDCHDKPCPGERTG